jgi:hypothetical protein
MLVMRGCEQCEANVHHNCTTSCFSTTFTIHAGLVLRLEDGTSVNMRGISECLVVIETIRNSGEYLRFECQSVTFAIQISLYPKLQVFDLDSEMTLANSEN